jgi:hypothetical protein
MIVNLDKQAMVSLVMGQQPFYSLFEHELVKLYGDYNEANGRWSWDKSGLLELTENQLWDLYMLCRNVEK